MIILRTQPTGQVGVASRKEIYLGKERDLKIIMQICIWKQTLDQSDS